MQMNSKGDRYKYLDGYRFIAVILVVLTHWLPSFLASYPLSKIGVDMFFVLSGFLITEILLKQKKEFNCHDQINLKKIYFSFYIRRSLRIFPIYYLVILFFFIISAPVIKLNLSFFLLYLTNLIIIRNEDWIGMFSHLWSLAIEEQFYIIWPILILSIPLKYLGKFIIALISSSLVYIFFSKSVFPFITIYSCMSTLSMGGLLAYLKITKSSYYTSAKYDAYILISAVTFFILVSIYLLQPLILHLSTMIFSFFLLKILLAKNSTLLDILLENQLITFLGKISYGLYLYHNFIPWLMRNLNGTETKLQFISTQILPVIKGGWGILFQHAFLLLLVSISSWYLVEKPINNLKKNFNY